MISYEEFHALAKEYNLIPISQELTADTETPISVYQKLVGEDQGFILESVEGGEHLGRYSFIGLRPFAQFTVNQQQCLYQANQQTFMSGNAFENLRSVMSPIKAAPIQGLPRFYGGAVGYFGYDIVQHIENIETYTQDELGLPDAQMMFPEVVVAFDHITHRMKLIVNVSITQDTEGCYQRALATLEETKQKLKVPIKETVHTLPAETAVVCSNTSKTKFMQSVAQAKKYIEEGDIFQVVLSQRLSAELQVSPFELYRTLRSVNPSPYLFFLNFGGMQLVGSSPEMLVRVEDGIVETNPIAGTRKRGANDVEDQRLAEELLADQKECAEHVMLVDLGRNDVGKVSRYGTVEIPTLMKIEKYSHVMHIVSSVTGQLNEENDCIDALRACFPAGTVSGAPKVRAMEIIAKLEGSKRGPYAGAVGYIGYSGNMDTCITIRTFVIADGQIHVQAGAGIVADSQPEAEYEETINKAKGLVTALEMTERRIYA